MDSEGFVSYRHGDPKSNESKSAVLAVYRTFDGAALGMTAGVFFLVLGLAAIMGNLSHTATVVAISIISITIEFFLIKAIFASVGVCRDGILVRNM